MSALEAERGALLHTSPEASIEKVRQWMPLKGITCGPEPDGELGDVHIGDQCELKRVRIARRAGEVCTLLPLSIWPPAATPQAPVSRKIGTLCWAHPGRAGPFLVAVRRDIIMSPGGTGWSTVWTGTTAWGAKGSTRIQSEAKVTTAEEIRALQFAMVSLWRRRRFPARVRAGPQPHALQLRAVGAASGRQALHGVGALGARDLTPFDPFNQHHLARGCFETYRFHRISW